MIKHKMKKVKMKVIEDVLCNKCGDSLVSARDIIDNPMREDVGEEQLSFSGLTEVMVIGGFYSSHLDDMTSYHFSLCEKCIKEMMDSFVIPVEKKELL